MGARSRGRALWPFIAAVLLSAAYVLIVRPSLDTLFWDFDEAWFMLDARLILRGQRPFVDFAYHQPPLHLYLLALSGKLFGQTLYGFRMLSLVSLATSALLLFALTQAFLGPVPGLVAQAVFLFIPAQMCALGAVAETPMVLFSLLGVVFLFVGRGRLSAYASGVSFVAALLVKPTCLLMVLAAVLSLAYAGAWRRLLDLTIAGVVGAAVGLAWLFVSSDGVFADTLTFHTAHLGARSLGMWTSIDSGFAEMRARLGVDTPAQWAMYCFRRAYELPWTYFSAAVFAASLLGMPIWFVRCARSCPSIAAFAIAWPVSYVILNFAAVDFVSPKYFIPFFAFSAFLSAAVAWSLLRRFPDRIRVLLGVSVCAALVVHLASLGERYRDPWFYGRAEWIIQQYPSVVSFTPMIFAATGAEPGCDFENAALTYGTFGETFLAGRLARFRVSDERLIACLRADPEMPLVVDWAFYFFTRPGSALREYLRGEGSSHRLFFSPGALEQWDRPVLSLQPAR